LKPWPSSVNACGCRPWPKWCEEDLRRLKQLRGRRRARHIGPFADSLAAVFQQMAGIGFIQLILGSAREGHIAGDFPGPFPWIIGTIEGLGELGEIPSPIRL